MIRWYEELPEQCPPSDADACSGIYYRLIKGDCAKEDDFISQRALNPGKDFGDIDECVARSLSVFDNEVQAKMRLKLPKFRKCKIAELTLSDDDGKMKKTFGPSHYSWWRSEDFDVKTVKLI